MIAGEISFLPPSGCPTLTVELVLGLYDVIAAVRSIGCGRVGCFKSRGNRRPRPTTPGRRILRRAPAGPPTQFGARFDPVAV